MAVAAEPQNATDSSVTNIIENEKSITPAHNISRSNMETNPPKESIDSSIKTHESIDDKPAFNSANSFEGDLDTNNKIPTQKTLKLCDEISVLNKDGKAVPFRSLYTGPNVARRVLVIFIRHFFCGNCQEYLRTLTVSITEDSLLQLPIPTFIAVVGCGDPSLIPMYQEATSCPFPIYADPTRQLYDLLGMTRTLDLGTRPDYQRASLVTMAAQSVFQGIKQLKGGKALKGGNYAQVGGEFLFEPININTPASSPAVFEENKELGITAPPADGEDKRVTWCHRMKNTRDHAEIPELREILGLDGVGVPGKDKKRWSKALLERKGTGFSVVPSGRMVSVSNGSGNVEQGARPSDVGSTKELIT